VNYSHTAADGTRETFTDNQDGTGLLERFNAAGETVQSETITGLPVPVPQPLDTTGALATLLVVEGVLTLTDAALAVQQPEQALIDEAEAWSIPT
jgi:hypothetical protein